MKQKLIQIQKEKDLFIDPIFKVELEKIHHAVTKKDRDFVMVFDGEEGSGKSVLAMQVAKYLDPNFTLDKLVFNADQFIEAIKSSKPNSCIVLDEAYNASSARGSLTEVNRSMVAVATEMRQRNLFVIFVLPTFFDLDKYFALWRCRALIHVYFNKQGGRGQYLIFPKTQKKFLYLAGKKKYDYSYPSSPYPPCRFYNQYLVDEDEYRLKKKGAFEKRAVSNRSKNQMDQRNAYIRFISKNTKLTQEQIAKIPERYDIKKVDQKLVSDLIQENIENED